MRFEATILLKTKKVDLERTQERTHFLGNLRLNLADFGAESGHTTVKVFCHSPLDFQADGTD
jgi:hypothetical protein